MLDFCSACDNSLALVFEDGQAAQRCLACGVLHGMPEGVHIIWERLGATAADSEMCRQYVDDAIHHDPTVPTMRSHCPTCNKDRRVRYVRYGTGLTYLYACPECKGFWTRVKGGDAHAVKARTETGDENDVEKLDQLEVVGGKNAGVEHSSEL